MREAGVVQSGHGAVAGVALTETVICAAVWSTVTGGEAQGGGIG
jgi:hypothetical protein